MIKISTDIFEAKKILEPIPLEEVGEQKSFANQIKVVRANCLNGQGDSIAAEKVLLEVLNTGDGDVLAEIRGKASLLLADIRESEGRLNDAEQLRHKGNALVNGAVGE